MAFWVDGEPKGYGPGDQYGLFHCADRAGLSFCPRVLLVYVHGILADCKSAWSVLPECLLDFSNVDVDSFSYFFPAKFLQRSSLASAARTLAHVLEAGLTCNYDHYVFITHSAGGLVVKNLLIDDLIRTREAASSSGIANRTRVVVNIAVPHAGARRGLAELGRKVMVTAETICNLIAPVVRSCSEGRRDWGCNMIFRELRCGNPDLIALESRYLDALRGMDEQNAPRPLSYEILAESEVAASGYPDIALYAPGGDHKARDKKLYVYADAKAAAVRGTHSSVKLPRRCSDLIVKVTTQLVALPKRLREYRKEADIAVALRTIARCETADRAARVTNLLGTHDNGPSVSVNRPNKAEAKRYYSVGQATMAKELHARIQHASDRPRRIVVTGEAGVGKSIVLRRVARNLATTFQPTCGSSGPLPIFYPLGRVTLSESDLTYFVQRPEGWPIKAWRMLMDHWCRWANTLVQEGIEVRRKGAMAPRELTVSWYENRLRHEPTVVILDGVDEFLQRNPRVSLGDIRDTIMAMQTAYQDNPGLVTILGVRNSQPGLVSLAASSNDVLAVTKLSIDDAERILPNLRQRVEGSRAEDFLDLLLTPLILVHLSPKVNLQDPRLGSRAGLVTTALEGILEWNEVGDTETWLDALMIIAWLFFSKFRGDIATAELRAEASVMCRNWEKQLGVTDVPHEIPTPIEGLRLTCNQKSLDDILRRTVFLPTERRRVAFTHQEWEDVLVGRYLTECIRNGFISELSHRAFRSDHFQIAGELMHDVEIDEPLVSRVFQTANQVPLVAGNFFGLMGNSRCRMTPRAINHLISAVDAMDATDAKRALARHVALTGLGYRSLANADGDTAAAMLRSSLLKILPTFGRRYGDRRVGALTASMAWCYMHAFAGRFGSVPASFEWPGLSEKDKADVFDWVWEKGQRDKEPTPLFRSLQLSYLFSQSTLPKEPARGITTLHYLYLLAVAWSEKLVVTEVQESLPELLADDSHIAKFVDNYTLVPELKKIFQCCQRLYREAS